ncbi:aminotransferase class V-fold PLP-dependent enzyme [Saccharopolyspora sp. ID03-671]|uniref:aminotransferase class V-fold PLP-dependent enzyme n=1 Tax=Saccharopolyspora sp. ID03-671 TaxID=3073066 RepID=UPI0032566210
MTSESFDVTRARRDTPGCTNVIHLNNAGASLMPSPVLDATVEYLHQEANIGGYEAAAASARAIDGVYTSAASLLGCATDEIAVVDSATRAWDMAFYSIPFQRGDRILTSTAEYASNFISYLQLAQRFDLTVDVVPNDETGQLSVEALENMMDDRVRLISLTHVPTNCGLVNPAVEVGRVAREAGVLYLLDACQSAGQIPLDVDVIGCDMLSITGRKYLRGPRGTGLLYVRRKVLEELTPPMLDLRAATWTSSDTYELAPGARRFETWECNYAAKVGLGAAIDYALEWGLAAIQSRVNALANELRARLSGFAGVEIRDHGADRCGIVAFTADGVAPMEVKESLSNDGINVSVSRAPSTRLDMETRGLDAVVRASVHYYNTTQELDEFERVLAKLLSNQ